MTTKPLITRKELAMLIGVVTVRQVASNERRWGLSGCKVFLNRKRVAYKTTPAISALKARDIL